MSAMLRFLCRGLTGIAHSKLPYRLVFGMSVCFRLGSPSVLERALYWSNSEKYSKFQNKSWVDTLTMF